jgi:hypothetical protein
MKKEFEDWRKFLVESKVHKGGNEQIDEGSEFVILYHVGWKPPSMPFEFLEGNMFSGEKRGTKRPLGDNALYCATTKEVALRYKKYSKLSYLYTLRYPTRELAGRLNPKHGASKEIIERYLSKWKSKEYGARFEDIRSTSGAIEVGIYDFSKIEVISHEALFGESDIDSILDDIREKISEIEDAVKNDWLFDEEVDELISYYSRPKQKEENRQARELKPSEYDGYMRRLMAVKEEQDNQQIKEK